MTAPACRLHVVLAREAPVAVILRRGPSAWYQVILWHTDRDRFEDGAWFKGRLYEERCDLSPDGQLFLYFALQGARWRTSYKGTWTAVSRPPWLHALVLWPQGDTWGGGGRFIGKRKVALFTGLPLATHPDHPLVGLEAVNATGTIAGPSSFLRTATRDRDAEWSGRDQAGEEVFTSKGRLFRRRRGRDLELADFRGRTPDPQPAPDWATAPLPPLPRPRRPRRR
jgi:hypothetical protein